MFNWSCVSQSGDQRANTLALPIVQSEKRDRHPSDWRLANHERAVQGKMFSPRVPPGMEEPHNLASPRLNAGKVGTLHQVAIGTGQGQVLRIVSAAMLARDDVFNMKAQFGKLLWEVAVLTTTARPAANQLD
jgi:hypothetical protein